MWPRLARLARNATVGTGTRRPYHLLHSSPQMRGQCRLAAVFVTQAAFALIGQASAAGPRPTTNGRYGSSRGPGATVVQRADSGMIQRRDGGASQRHGSRGAGPSRTRGRRRRVRPHPLVPATTTTKDKPERARRQPGRPLATRFGGVWGRPVACGGLSGRLFRSPGRPRVLQLVTRSRH